MAKIFYLPYAKYELDSDLSKEELVANIRNEITNHNLVGELFSKNRGRFSGAINMEHGLFKIRSRTVSRNSFKPIIFGEVSEKESGSKINLKLRLPIFTYVFVGIWLSLWLGFWLYNIEEVGDLLTPLGGAAFVYFLMFFGFNLGVGKALDDLYEIT